MYRDGSGLPDAVLLDGDIWRSVHGGYNRLVKFGADHGCIFKAAWGGQKQTFAF